MTSVKSSKKIRGLTSFYVCKCCGEKFLARVADRKRGWARFCSKSCKAIKQVHDIGYPALGEYHDQEWDPSWDAHKLL